jgi:hypothetical protein
MVVKAATGMMTELSTTETMSIWVITLLGVVVLLRVIVLAPAATVVGEVTRMVVVREVLAV